jgi:serine/threonine protein kinase
MPEQGESLGRYTLLKRLAAGGMGEIFLAARTGPIGFAPPVALKVLRDELASDSQFVDMLVDEAKISMFLNHQNVVSVLDFGEHSGRYYIAMEYVQGVTLKQLLEAIKAQGKKLGLAVALYVGGELCRALKYAHTRTNHAGEPLNIIHRDVTPGNVLLSIQGEVKLTDFGIARARGRMHETQAGVLKGKFGYMAPEMLRYEKIDLRADLFCAGVILYEMIAGQHPVEGAGIMEAIQRLDEKNIQPPSYHNPEIPKALDAILLRALEPKPDARWGSAAALGTALQDIALANVELRKEIRSGGQQLAALIRQFFPEAFDSAVPPELSEGILAEARAKERETKDLIERSVRAPAPDVGPMVEDRTDEQMAVSPPRNRSIVISTPEIEAFGHNRVAAMTTAHVPLAPSPTDTDADDMYPTLIPSETNRRGGSADPHRMKSKAFERAAPPPAKKPGREAFQPHNGTQEDSDTDEHLRDKLKRAAAGSGPGAPADAATMTFQPRPSAAEVPIQFPDTSTDRARLHDELIVEPERPASDATIPLSALSAELIAQAHANEATIAVGSDPLVDPRTTASDAVPSWLEDRTAGEPGSPPIPIDPGQARFAEAVRPATNTIESDYDDGATAFSPNRVLNALPSKPPDVGDDESSLNEKTVAGMPEKKDDDDDDDDSDAQHDTLLDGISADDVAKAKAQIDKKETRLRVEPLKEEAFVWEDAAAPKKLSGPLRIRVSAEGQPAIAQSGDLPRPPDKGPERPVVTPAPHPPASDRTEMDPAGADADVGTKTGKWMAGELQASDLSWSDDAAARRVIATRNQQKQPNDRTTPMSGPPPATPSKPPPAAAAKTGPQPVPGPAVAPQAGMPQGPPSTAYPVPQKLPPGQKSLLIPIAISLAVLALATVAAVVLFTRAAWPEVTFDSTPPGAIVLIDGKVVQAKTPVTVKVRPSTQHQVELRLTGYPLQKIEPPVEVGYLEARTYAVTFEEVKRFVHIAPVPGRVFVNYNEVGSGSSVQLPQITAEGQILLRVEADGFKPWSLRFDSADQIPASLDVPLQKQ